MYFLNVPVLYWSYMFRLPHSSCHQAAEKKQEQEIIYQ